MATVDDSHYGLVADLIRDGDVIPFLGAGANLCDRPDGAAWEVGRYLPSGQELAKALAERSRYPIEGETDLLRVSQYVDAVLGEGGLYRHLRSFFAADYPPSSLHDFLARLPQFLRERGAPQQLVITTNYDDALEGAFGKLNEPYDLLWYEAKKGSVHGMFLHRPPGGEPIVIDRPNEYDGLSPGERTVILKLHGAIDREDPKRDSYVITEDNYIDYLSGGDVGRQLPMVLRDRMGESHFLFLGYSMRDWNLRVILNRIWGQQPLDLRSWSIQREPDDPSVRKIEKILWKDRGAVDLLYIPLKEYVASLSHEVFRSASVDVGS